MAKVPLNSVQTHLNQLWSCKSRCFAIFTNSYARYVVLQEPWDQSERHVCFCNVQQKRTSKPHTQDDSILECRVRSREPHTQDDSIVECI